MLKSKQKVELSAEKTGFMFIKAAGVDYRLKL